MIKLLKLSAFLAMAAVLALMLTACGDGSSGSGDNGSPPSNDPPSGDPPSGDPPSGDPPSLYDSMVTVSVSIRDAGATISVPGTLKDSYTLYASQDDDCDVSSYEGCTEGEMHSLSAATTSAEVTALTTADTAYFTLKNEDSGVSRSFTVAPHPPFVGRFDHRVVVFQDKLWLIGGLAGIGEKNDVWSSGDGIEWNQVTTTTPAGTAVFSPRSAHQVVVFQSKLWLIGGQEDAYSHKSDVWISDDGTTWTEETAEADFGPRGYHHVVVFGNKFWLSGGYDGVYKDDVWSSDDGATWTQETDAATSALRAAHQVVVFDNKLWLISGWNGWLTYEDVWSFDGATWTEETDAAGFGPRTNHQVVIFKDKPLLIGGFVRDSNSRFNDVWSSADGSAWTQETDEADFSDRGRHQVVVFKEQLWLIGGYDGSSYFNDVWRSADGITWKNALHEQTVSLTFE